MWKADSITGALHIIAKWGHLPAFLVSHRASLTEINRTHSIPMTFNHFPLSLAVLHQPATTDSLQGWAEVTRFCGQCIVDWMTVGKTISSCSWCCNDRALEFVFSKCPASLSALTFPVRRNWLTEILHNRLNLLCGKMLKMPLKKKFQMMLHQTKSKKGAAVIQNFIIHFLPDTYDAEVSARIPLHNSWYVFRHFEEIG